EHALRVHREVTRTPPVARHARAAGFFSATLPPPTPARPPEALPRAGRAHGSSAPAGRTPSSASGNVLRAMPRGRAGMGLPAASLHDRGAAGYDRRRPETTALYELVRDNLDTLYGAI